MTRVEEIFFEAYDLGIHNELYNTVSKMIHNGDHRYVEMHVIYERALEKEKEVLYNNNLYEPTDNSEVHQQRA